MSRLKKSLLIGFFAVVISTLGIQASDLLQGVDGNLVGLANKSQGPCGKNAELLLLGDRALCVDTYEASAGDGCTNKKPQNPRETQDNLNQFDCKPQSEAGVEPWRFVSFTEASQLCARASKRLPTNEEWFMAVSGLSDVESCNIDSGAGAPQVTGASACVSPLGVYDLVGNVWEWIDEEIVNGEYNGRELPETGYVSSVDTKGVVVETATKPVEQYGDDYAWTDASGVRAMIRGGFYGSGDDAGLFAQNMSVRLDFQTAGVGFRCVKDVQM